MPLRLVVNDLFKSQSLGSCAIAGRVETGTVGVGDQLVMMPQAETVTVKSMQVQCGTVKQAAAGTALELGLSGLADPSSVRPGCVLCPPHFPISAVCTFKAQLLTINLHLPITPGQPVELYCHAQAQAATVSKILALVDKTGQLGPRPRCLTGSMAAIVRIRCEQPICLELYSEFKQLGRFLLRRQGVTIAAGIVTELQAP